MQGVSQLSFAQQHCIASQCQSVRGSDGHGMAMASGWRLISTGPAVHRRAFWFSLSRIRSELEVSIRKPPQKGKGTARGAKIGARGCLVLASHADASIPPVSRLACLIGMGPGAMLYVCPVSREASVPVVCVLFSFRPC